MIRGPVDVVENYDATGFFRAFRIDKSRDFTEFQRQG
jgi:hypothetical protein